MNYKVKQIVRNALVVDGLEFVVNDRVKIHMNNGDVFSCVITDIYDECIRVCNLTFGYCTINYSDIENVMPVEK